MAKKKTTEQAAKALKEIMAQLNPEVIKDYEMPTLCNLDTGKEIGFAVVLTLSTKFDYTDVILAQWREKLKADNYMISVRRNQLKVRFNVMY